MNVSLKEFEKQFSKSTQKIKEYTTQDYLNSNYTFLGFIAKDVRSFKFELYTHLEVDEKIQFLDLLISQSKISEVVSWALYRLDEIEISKLIKHKTTILSFANYIENWWHSDQLASILAKILDEHKLLFQSLNHFNNSSNFWLKRLSITSIYYYSSLRSNPIPFNMSSKLVEKLLLDEEYYVQKGVGWILREMSNLYYEETLNFLILHAKHISSIAFSSASEKLNYNDKEHLKQLRKKGISNKHEFHGHRKEEINEFDLQTKRYKK